MGNSSCSDSFPEGFTSKYLKVATEHKFDFIFDTSKPSLNFSILKAVSLIFLKSYSEESRISDYYSSLKRFVETYDYMKFATFLANFSWFTFEEEINCCYTPQPETATSPQRPWLRDPQLVSSRKSHENSRRQTHFYIDESPKPEVKNHDKTFVFTVKILKFFEVEVANEQNFFFELVKVFSALFVTKHKKSLRLLKTQFSKTGLAEKQIQKLNKIALKKYTDAKYDLQQFLNILLNTLKSFMTQMQTNIVQHVSFLISPQNLENLSLKLLFRKNKCYKTYLKLIKYHVRGEEALLTKCLTSLKLSKPEDFNIDPHLCLKGEEEPYKRVIDSLDYLEVLTTPFDKFKAILELRKEILKAVQSYYKKERLCESTIPELTANNLVPIYCYCLVRNGIAKIKRHQVFIQDFLNKELMKTGDQSFYFITFIAAINFLISIADDDPVKKLLNLG